MGIIERLGRTSIQVSQLPSACALGSSALELQQPVRFSRPHRPLETLSGPAPSNWPWVPAPVSAVPFGLSASGWAGVSASTFSSGFPFPPSSPPCGAGWAGVSASAYRRLLEPEGPAFRREKQAV